MSKTIESAQTRVEGFNFDIRKHVVEFDDVMNKQRETIYAERDKVLRNEDLTETVRGVPGRRDRGARRPVPRRAVAQRVEPGGPLRPPCARWASTRPRRSEEALDEAAESREVLIEHLRELADGRLEARMAEHGDEVWSQVERFVLLRTIDSLWVEHLTELDDMRRGIGLRGYAQQDPLNEFRKEAFRLYEELRDLIRRQVATTIFRVTVRREPATVPLPGPGSPPATPRRRRSTRRPRRAPNGAGGGRPVTAAGRRRGPGAPHRGPGRAAPAGTGTPAGSVGDQGPRCRPDAHGAPDARRREGDRRFARPGFTPSGARIGRNEPCWCGSGQKYKKCHGA